MATKKSNEAKVTLWNDTMRVDFSGTIMACCLESFKHIMGGPENRERALKMMQTRHDELKEKGL